MRKLEVKLSEGKFYIVDENKKEILLTFGTSRDDLIITFGRHPELFTDEIIIVINHYIRVRRFSPVHEIADSPEKIVSLARSIRNGILK